MLLTLLNPDMLPIYFILGASDFAKLKMETCPRVGQNGETFMNKQKWAAL